jgi:hypothetical protein
VRDIRDRAQEPSPYSKVDIKIGHIGCLSFKTNLFVVILLSKNQFLLVCLKEFKAICHRSCNSTLSTFNYAETHGPKYILSVTMLREINIHSKMLVNIYIVHSEQTVVQFFPVSTHKKGIFRATKWHLHKTRLPSARSLLSHKFTVKTNPASAVCGLLPITDVIKSLKILVNREFIARYRFASERHRPKYNEKEYTIPSVDS